MKSTTLITLGTVGLSLVACTSSSSPSSSPTGSSSPQAATPSSDDYDDVAQTVAQSTISGGMTATSNFGDVIAMGDALSIARGRLPFGFLRDSGHSCHGDHMGVDNAFTIACKDAAGAAQTQCDSTSDSATVTLKMSGNLSLPDFMASIDREGSWTLTGLQSDTATLDGTSTFSLDTSITSIFHQGASASLTFDATAAYKAITIATADRKPNGGEATFEIKAHKTVTCPGGGSGSGSDGSGSGGSGSDGSGSGSGSDDGSNGSGAAAHHNGGGNDHGGTCTAEDKSFDVTADLKFNGDGTATLVLDGTQTFTIDLKSGKITKSV